MTTTREETVRAEHRRALRACAVWAAVVPAATLPLCVFNPIVGFFLAVVAVGGVVRARRVAVVPFAHGAFHWRLVAEAFRHAMRVQFVVGAFAAAFAALFWAVPRSDGAAAAAVSLGVVLFFSTLYAVAVPRGVLREHALNLLVERKPSRRIGWEATLLMMKRAEDVDRRAILLFGGPLVSAAVESAPPFKAAFDDPPDEAALRDRLVALAESFDEDRDDELSEALRATAAAVETARDAGVRCRLASVPPYPTAQALDLMGSVRRYA